MRRPVPNSLELRSPTDSLTELQAKMEMSISNGGLLEC